MIDRCTKMRFAHSRVLHDRGGDPRRINAGHDAKHALGQTGLLEDADELQGGQGCELGGLYDHVMQPAALAGPSSRVIMAAGKFHGVVAATPTGRFMTRMRLSGKLAGTVSP